jgi:hypothetical protein
MLSLSIPSVSPGKLTKIEVNAQVDKEGKDVIEVKVDGKQQAVFGGDAVGPGGQIGIMYSGIGNHRFRDLEMSYPSP